MEDADAQPSQCGEFALLLNAFRDHLGVQITACAHHFMNDRLPHRARIEFEQLHVAAVDEHRRQRMLRIQAFGLPAMMRDVVDERVRLLVESLSNDPMHEECQESEEQPCSR